MMLFNKLQQVQQQAVLGIHALPGKQLKENDQEVFYKCPLLAIYRQMIAWSCKKARAFTTRQQLVSQQGF
jgi:hypothetical protein